MPVDRISSYLREFRAGRIAAWMAVTYPIHGARLVQPGAGGAASFQPPPNALNMSIRKEDSLCSDAA